MIFEFLDLKPRNPYLSLAMDEAIALHFGRHTDEEWGAGIRLWSNPYSIIMGRTCKFEENLINQTSERYSRGFSRKNWNQVPYICRRMSGGGTVVHGPGNINFSFFFPQEKHPGLYAVKESYRVILGMVQRALEAQGYTCKHDGHSDLVLQSPDGGGVKISGNAQFRKYGVIVHHGTLITHSSLIDLISNQLSHPPKEPGYRNGRDHKNFLGALPGNFDITAFYNFLTNELKSLDGSSFSSSLPAEVRRSILASAGHMARDLYSNSDWIFSGRAPGKRLDSEGGDLKGPGGFPSGPSGSLRRDSTRRKFANHKGRSRT